MNCCKHKYFVIYRGDDTDFPGNQELIVELNTTRDLTGCSAHFSFQGFTQDFDEIPADKKLHLIIPSSATSNFALGAADAKLWLTNGTKIRTVENRIHIVVTNRVDEAYNNDDPQAITVTISGGGGGATVVLDDTVTEESTNGVKSSGIWSWVKSLLPQWLTSDYSEPATVASVANKRDKTDLDIKLPSIESCTWGTPNVDLRDALIGVVPVFSNGKWSAVAGQWTSNLVPGTGYEERISFLFSGLIDDVPANATLVRGEPETVDNIAKKSELTAGLAAKQSKITVFGILKGNGQGGVTAATKSSTSAGPANADYRDPQDNTCHKTEFGEWSHDHQTSFGEVGQPSFNNGEWHWKDENGNNVLFASGTEDDTDLYFRDVENTQEIQLHSTRSAICTSGEKYMTPSRIFDNDGKPTDQFAADLLGKQVANIKANSSAFAPEYDATSGYAVDKFVWYDGNIYQCKTAIAEGGEAWNAEHWELRKLDDFFTESNSLLNGRLAYSRNATGLKDRAFNALTFDGTEYNLSTALAAVTPTASGQPRDLLIVATATAATTISFTAGTIKGDKPTIDGSGTWLITLTEYASGVWYCRQIKMEDAA